MKKMKTSIKMFDKSKTIIQSIMNANGSKTSVFEKETVRADYNVFIFNIKQIKSKYSSVTAKFVSLFLSSNGCVFLSDFENYLISNTII